ncbi:hypothetical protein B4U80_02679 [Leptotrombidium deliense]|uniref:Uncharacterized protein n=1 Tax=Leptotrombidium deliense TaxID=299467 RepID=A0A443S2F4_9ACAR|nr:hypothetical protein B4U80_02679 [Leptotrombidium deliense]
MVNSISEINQFLDDGCNAIETDIKFDNMGRILNIFHGFPCDCFRLCNREANVADYFEYTRKITTPGDDSYRDSYALILLDLKTSKIEANYLEVAGKLFFDILYRHLFDSGKSMSKLKVLISVESTSHKAFIYTFVNEVKRMGIESNVGKYIGWQISFNEDIKQIDNMWREIEDVTHIWYSHGTPNCVAPFFSFKRGVDIMDIRDSCDVAQDTYCPRKVYYWSLDEDWQLRNSLRAGVDGIITNKPARLNTILAENEFQRTFRLATIDDDAWAILK